MKDALSKSLLLTLMLAVFLDIANFFMPVPIFSPLFLHTNFLLGYSHETKVILLGLLVGCYGLAQLFGGPIFGEISDQYGRKKAILLSMSVAIIGCLIGGIGLTANSLFLLFLSRLLIGFGSGTVAVVFAITADKSTNQTRAKNLGYINIGLSIGAAIGPIIGGHLIFSHLGSTLAYAIPFYFMALLYLVNGLLVYKLLPVDQATRKTNKKIHPFTAFQNLNIVMKRSRLLCCLVIMGLFFQLGNESFFLASPIVGVQKFHMSPSQLSNYFMLFGIIAAITSWWINKIFSRYFSSGKIYLGCSILLIATLIFLITGNSALTFVIPFIGMGIFAVTCWIHINNLFSENVDETEQGLIFGVSQSLWSLGGMLGTVLVGFAAAAHYKVAASIPISFQCLSLIAAIVMVVLLMKKKRS